MRVIKPMTLGLLTRPYEFRRKFHLGIAVLSFVPMDGRPALLKETAMWQFLAKALAGQPVDAAIPKAQGEFLVVGNGYAPDGKPVTRLRVGAMLGARRKMLQLVGKRLWDGREATPPEPFTSMPIEWKHAFGGEGYADNPLGLGAGAEEATKEAPVRLPMVLANRPKSGEYRIPAGFGQVDLMWPARARLVGTYEDAWLKHDFPGFARDIDWRFFNIAPPDQQFGEMLVGDEDYAFENLHPAKPLFKGKLPGVAPRAFVDRGGDAGFAEIPLSLTTVWFFPEALRLVMVHHGVAEVGHELADDVPRILLGADMLGERRDAQDFRAVMERRLDRKNGGAALALRDRDLVPEALLLPDTAMDAALKAAKSENLRMIRARRRKEREHEAIREKLLAQGVDPAKHEIPPLPPEPEIEMPDSIEDIPAFAAKMKAEAEQREQETRRKAEEAEAEAEAKAREMGASEADIVRMREQRKQKPKGPPAFSAAGMRRQLEEIVAQGRALGGDMSPIAATLEDPKAQASWEMAEDKLATIYIASAQHQDPAPRLDSARSAELRAELAGAVPRSWNRVNFCGADLSGIDLSGRDLAGIWLDGANLRDANLTNANLKDAVLAHADLEGARLDGANLEGANLGGARLRDASLVGASLKKAILAKADLSGADLSTADLSEPGLVEMVLSGARLERARALGWKVLKQTLPQLDARGMDLTKAVFIETDLSGANFAGATLERAAFVKCVLIGASFAGAILKKACFVGCDATGAKFTKADLTSANLRGLMLMGADFSQAEMPGADLSGAELTAVSFATVNATGARLADARLSSASMKGANFKKADFARADLRAADLSGVCAYEANLARAVTDRGTSVSGMKRTRMRYLPLAEAK